MSGRTVIELAQCRASDVRQGDVIVLAGERGWRYVYDVDRAGQGQPSNPDVAYLLAHELDERYVVLRLADDPEMQIGAARGDAERDACVLLTWPRGKERPVNRFGAGAPAEFEDAYRVLLATDLVTVQIERTVTA